MTDLGSPQDNDYTLVWKWRNACFHAFEQYQGDDAEVGGDFDAAADAAVLVLIDHLLSADPDWPLGTLSELRQAIASPREVSSGCPETQCQCAVKGCEPRPPEEAR